MHRTLHFVVTFPLFRFSAYLSCFIHLFCDSQPLCTDHRCSKCASRDSERKLSVCLLDQLLWCMEANWSNSNILPRKRRISCLRAAPEINEGQLHFQNHGEQKRHLMLCFEKDLLKSWQQRHNELNAQWDDVWVAKCLHQFQWRKQSLICRQLASNYSPRTRRSLSPIHHLSRDQRETPQRNEDHSNLHSHSNRRGSTIPQWLSISLYHNCHPKTHRMPKSSNYRFLQKGEGFRKVKMLITMFQRDCSICSMTHPRTCPCLFSSTSNTFLNIIYDQHACSCPHAPDCSISQSIPP